MAALSKRGIVETFSHSQKILSQTSFLQVQNDFLYSDSVNPVMKLYENKGITSKCNYIHFIYTYKDMKINKVIQ